MVCLPKYFLFTYLLFTVLSLFLTDTKTQMLMKYMPLFKKSLHQSILDNWPIFFFILQILTHDHGYENENKNIIIMVE